MRTIVITPSESGPELPLSRDEWHRLVLRSVEHWNRALAKCCAVEFAVAAPTSTWLANEDGLNLIVLRTGPWCHNERCGKDRTFPLGALGMTTMYPEGAVGVQVREADVEINATHIQQLLSGGSEPPAWGMTLPGSVMPVKLEAVVVHELGHVLGLEDVCGNHSSASGGSKSGFCPDTERDRVMFAPSQLLNPTRRDLEVVRSLFPASTRASLAQSPMAVEIIALGAGILLTLAFLVWRATKRPEM